MSKSTVDEKFAAIAVEVNLDAEPVRPSAFAETALRSCAGQPARDTVSLAP